MKKLVLDYQNYKKPGTGNAEAEGRIIIFGGENRVGKTSIIKGIIDNCTAKNSGEPLSRDTDAKEGYKMVKTQDKHGNPITIFHTFSRKNPKGSFYAEREDGSKIEKVNEIRELMGEIAPYTVEEIFYKTRSAAGRREIIKEIFSVLIPEDQKRRIDTIDSQIKTKGTLYVKRTDANADLRSSKTRLEKEKESYTSKLKELNFTEKELIEKHKELSKEKENQLSPKEISHINQAIEFLNKRIEGINTVVKSILQLEMNAKEETKKYEKEIADFSKSSKVIIPMLEEMIATRNRKLESSFDQDYYDSLNNIISLKSSVERLEKEVKENTKKVEDINIEMEKLEDEKDNILQNKTNLPKGLLITGESDFSFNGFDFNEDNISESEAWLLILEIMMKIYDGYILFAGKTDVYDDSSREKLIKLADDNDKQVLLEQIESDGPVYVEAHISADTFTSKNKANERVYPSQNGNVPEEDDNASEEVSDTLEDEKGYEETPDEKHKEIPDVNNVPEEKGTDLFTGGEVINMDDDEEDDNDPFANPKTD